ncbi:hypothetical protein [Haloplanus sp. C73]|uniref:hypothetical protein n=1 Tax=Haloplanus sp. C73 TaxID=3421641 RepID=UPI003EC04CC3
MVGPSITDEDRRRANRRLKGGFVALVGVSGGLVSLAIGASLEQAALAVVAGCLVGAILVVYLGHIGREWRQSR